MNTDTVWTRLRKTVGANDPGAVAVVVGTVAFSLGYALRSVIAGEGLAEQVWLVPVILGLGAGIYGLGQRER